jgi:hypothetical protein
MPLDIATDKANLAFNTYGRTATAATQDGCVTATQNAELALRPIAVNTLFCVCFDVREGESDSPSLLSNSPIRNRGDWV